MANIRTNLISLGISVLMLIVGAVVWANTQHNNIHQDLQDKITFSEQDIYSRVEEGYAKKDSISRIEENLRHQEKLIDHISARLDRVLEILDN